MPGANKPQCQFLQLPQKNRAYVGGFGSGKTFAGCMATAIHHCEHPRVPSGYFAPTYPMIRDIFYPTIDEVAFEFGLNTKVQTGNKEVDFYSGKQYRGTTICRSMENPNNIIGFKIGHALVDELDTMPTMKALQAWRKILARMRADSGAGELRNGVDVTTTPEGFKATHQLFVSDLQERPNLRDRYGMIQASTYENEANLPEDYIPSLYEAYTKELVDAYINGRFCNLTAGTVYRNFDRAVHNSVETIRAKKGDEQEAEALFIGMDFNVMKMAATIYVQRPTGWHAVAELKDVFDTPDMIRIIKERWQNKGHRIIVYPDPSGKNREAVNASSSDIALLEQAGFTCRYSNANPPVRDRINATNKQFEKCMLWVNVKACPTVTRALESQAYDPNGEPEKDGFEHQNDATTYPIIYEFPVVTNRIKRVVVHGH